MWSLILAYIIGDIVGTIVIYVFQKHYGAGWFPWPFKDLSITNPTSGEIDKPSHQNTK
jgi:hypothetical protein